MDRLNFKRGSSNTQSACRISHASIRAVLPAAHICEQCVWLASARLSAPVSLLFFPGSEPGRTVAACLMSAAVLCMEAHQSQPRGSVSGCKLTCSLPTPTPARSTLLRGLSKSSAVALSRWDEVCKEGYSYGHSSFQTKAFYPAAFSLSHSKSWRREHRTRMSKHTSTARELSTHSLLWGEKAPQAKDRDSHPTRIPAASLPYVHLCAQIPPSSRVGSTTHR